MTTWTYRELRGQGLSEGTIRWRAEQGRLIRPTHGIYLRAPADDRDRLRALAHRVPHGVMALGTAAWMHGFGSFVPDSSRPTLILPAGLPRARLRGVRVVTTVLPFTPVLIDGIPCQPAARCAVDLARLLHRPDALAVLDGALRTRACNLDELATEAARHRGLRGITKVKTLLRYADPGAACRQESHLRLLALDAHLPPPRTQLRILDDFEHVRYILDLGWEQEQVGAEYDGMSHLDRHRLRHDRTRHNWLSNQGWRMRYFTDHDLYRAPATVAATLRQTLLHPSRSSRASILDLSGSNVRFVT